LIEQKILSTKRNKGRKRWMYLARHIHYTNGEIPQQLVGYTALKPKQWNLNEEDK